MPRLVPLAKAEVDGVLVDSCAVHGTWFDAGEVNRIANAFTTKADKPAAAEPSWDHLRSGSSSSSSTEGSFVDGLFAVLDEIDDYRPR